MKIQNIASKLTAAGGSSPSSEPLIKAREVVKTYRLGKTRVEALRGVDLDLWPGEFIALAGPSGSGKTTLLNIIGCLDKPDSGTLTVDGQDVTTRATHALAGLRNQSFGFIFQTFNLIQVLTAFENVEFPLVLAGVARAERRRRTEELLERVGLAEHMRHRPNQLSGGQRQRVAIARALVTEPIVVFADEPTANLDSRVSQDIIELMASLNQERGSTFVFSTHDPQILSSARRILRLTDGVLAENGAVESSGDVEESRTAPVTLAYSSGARS